MSDKTKTLITSSTQLKEAFKIECAKNNVDMSTITQILWKGYIMKSLERRERNKQKNTEIS